MTITLDEDDFKFIKHYMKIYKIKEGQGKAIEISLIINEYKKFIAKDTNNTSKENNK